MKLKLKRIKSNKGFSFVELLAVITILGILMTVTIVVYNSYKKKAQQNYYTKQEDLLTQSGRDFFIDNKGKLPQTAGEESCVRLNTLVKNNYISEIEDYNNNTCNGEKSMVCAVKISSNKYIYHSILDCGNKYETKTYVSPTIKMNPQEGTTVGPLTVKSFTVEMKIGYDNNVDDSQKSDITSYRYVIYKVEDGEAKAYLDSGWKNVKESKKEVNVSIPIAANGQFFVVGNAYNSQGKSVEVKSGTISIKNELNCNTDIVYNYGTYNQKWTNQDITTNITVKGGVTRYDIELINTNNGVVVTKDSNVLPQIKDYVIKDEGTYKYKITAYDVAGNSCTKESEEYKIDKTAPLCTVTSNHSDWTNQPVRLTGKCTETHGSGCKQEYTYADFNAETNTEYLMDNIVDNAGNVATCNKVAVKIDTKKPTCTITTSKNPDGENNWYKSNVDVMLTHANRQDSGSGIAAYDLTTSTTATYNNTDANMDQKITQTSDVAAITYYGYVVDNAGNIGTCNKEIKKDSTAPTCTLTTNKTPDGENGWYKSTFNIELSSENRKDETSGIAGYNLVNSNSANYSKTSASDNLSLTINTDTPEKKYYGFVKDNAGNTGSCDITIKRDTKAPTCSITTSKAVDGENGWYKSNVDISLNSSNRKDTTSGVTSYDLTTNTSPIYYETDTSSNKTVTQDDDTTGITYYGYVKDDAGNTGSCNISIKKDSTPPVCSLTTNKDADGENGWYKSNVDIKMLHEDRTDETSGIAGYNLADSNSANYSKTSATDDLSLTLNTDVKNKNYYGFVKDNAGNTGNCTINLKRDTTAPTCSIVTNKDPDGDNDWYRSNVEVILSGVNRSDEISGVTSYDFTTSSTPSYNQTNQIEDKSIIRDTDTAGITYYGYVKDDAGNTGSCSKSIKRDATVPTCSVTTSKDVDGDNGWYKSNVDVKLDAANRKDVTSGIVGYSFSTSTTPEYNETNNALNKSLTQSANTSKTTYYGYVKDAAGNTAKCSKEIKKDSEKPTCTITVSKNPDGNNNWYKSNVDVKLEHGNRNDNLSGIVGYNLTTSGTATYTETSTTADKSLTQSSDTTGTTYYGYIKDAAGNTGSCTKSIKRDTTSPTCTLVASKEPDGVDGWYASSVDIILKSTNRKDTTSGVVGYDLTTSSAGTYTETNIAADKSLTQSANTDGTTYYGHVKDDAGNVGSCNLPIKKTNATPGCKITVSKDPDGENGWYKSNVTVSLTAANRNPMVGKVVGYNLTTSSTPNYDETNETATKSLTQSDDTTGTTYYGYIKNDSGQIGQCQITIKKDSVKPTCSLTKSKNADGENGWYKSNVTVSLTAANRDDATSGITGYNLTTTSAASYTETSATATKSLTQSNDTPGTTYYGHVKDAAGNTGNCSTTIYKDTVSPTCTITTSKNVDGENGWYKSNVDVYLKAANRVDATSGIRGYNLTTSTTASYTETSPTANKSITQSNDTTGITYYGYVKDVAGNIGSCNKTIKKDSEVPPCTITTSKNPDGANGWYKSNVDVYLTAANRADETSGTVGYNLVASTTASYTETNATATKTITHSAESTGTTYYGYVKDAAGNTKRCSKTIKKDSVKPTCSITVSKEPDGTNGYYKSPVDIYLKAADRKDTTSGVTGYDMTTSSSASYSYTSSTQNITKNQSTNTDGTTYYGYVRDGAGNTNSCSKVIKMRSETPTCTLTVSKSADGENGWYKSSVTVSLTAVNRNPAAGTITGYNLTTSSTPSYTETNATATKSLTQSADTTGTTYYGYVKNSSGEVGQCQITIKKDSTAPTCTVTTSKNADGANSWYKSNVDVYLKAENRKDATSGVAGYKFKTTNSAEYTDTSTTADKTLTQSANTTGTTYYGFVKDNAGNTGSCSKVIKKDPTTPTCTLTTSKDPDGKNSWYKSNVDVKLTAANRVSSVSPIAGYNLTTNTTASYTETNIAADKSVTHSAESAGTTYYGYVKNEAGTTGKCQITIKKDSVAPTCTVTTSKNPDGTNSWYKTNVDVKLTAANRKDATSGVNSYSFTTSSNASYTETNIAADKTLTHSAESAGTTYYGYVKDAAGNTGSCSKVIKKDSVAPTCTVTASKDPDGTNSWYKSNVDLYLTSANRKDTTSGVAGYNLVASTTASYTETNIAATKTVTHSAESKGTTYYGYVKDAAGNTGSCSKAVKKDSVAPTCTLTTSKAADGTNSWYKTNVDVKLTAANRKDTTSGVSGYNLTTSTTASYTETTATTDKSVTHSAESKGTIYYGYVKDAAGNTGSCSTTIKKDSVAPTCTITVSKNPDGANNWYKTNVDLYLTAANRVDATSGVSGYNLTTSTTASYTETSTTETKKVTHSAETSGTTYNGYVKDAAGNTGKCTKSIAKDSIPPIINLTGKRCFIFPSAGGASSGNASYTQDLDSSGCLKLKEATTATDTRGEMYFTEWNKAGATFNYSVTETNFDKISVAQNSKNIVSSSGLSVGTPTNYTSKTGTLTVTDSGNRRANFQAFDKAGNSSYIDAYVSISKAYKVIFNLNNGSHAWTSSTCSGSGDWTASSKTCSKEVVYGYTYGSLPYPKITNYEFEGWYTTASGGTKVHSSTLYKHQSDQTLYAHWQPAGLKCKPSGSWSKSSSAINFSGTAASTTFKYTSAPASKDRSGKTKIAASPNGGSGSLGRSLNVTKSSLTNFEYVYGYNTTNVLTNHCQSRYDAQTPYTPFAYNFRPDSKDGNKVKVTRQNCYQTEDRTAAATCSVVAKVPQDGKVYTIWCNYGGYDRPSTDKHGYSDVNYILIKNTYKNNSTCTEKHYKSKGWTPDHECNSNVGIVKKVFTTVDNAGNTSASLTVNYTWNYY